MDEEDGHFNGISITLASTLDFVCFLIDSQVDEENGRINKVLYGAGQHLPQVDEENGHLNEVLHDAGRCLGICAFPS